MPLTCDFDQVVCGIEQSDRAATRRKDPGRKTERRRKHLFAGGAALQELSHLGQQSRALGSFLECLHHLFVLFVQSPAGEVFFAHFLLQAGIRIGEFFGALFDLLLKNLLVLLLLLDIGADPEPLLDDAFFVAQRNGAVEIPLITLVEIEEAVFDLEPLPSQHAFLPFFRKGARSSG